MFSLVSAARDLSRLREIYVVLVRHGFGEIVTRLRLAKVRHPKDDTGGRVGESIPPPSEGEVFPPEELSRGEAERLSHSFGVRLRLVAQDLGPTFVKLGQLLSTRSDVIPQDIVTELRKLQDDVPPCSFDDVRDQIESSLGVALDDVFESFDPQPIAAASIGQVHRAVLKRDTDAVPVAVKVQRPGVDQIVARDLDLLHGLARLVERAIPESRIYSPTGLVEQFERAITSELDFRGEAENAVRFAKNFDGDPSVVFPAVHRQASSRRVLTLEFLRGVKIYDAIRAGFSAQAIAQKAIHVVIKQIMEDGFFHADPHPGNIVIMGTPAEPVFGMFDLGMVGRLPPEIRDKTLDLMVAAVRRDYTAIADAMYAIGSPTRKVDMRAYRADVAELADKWLGRPLKDIELSALVRDIIQGATRHGIEVPSDFLLVAKALMTIEGVAKEVCPDLDVFEEAKPHFFDLLRKRYSPQRIGSDVWRGIERLSIAAYDMPAQITEVLDDLRLGRLTVKGSVPELGPAVDRLGRRLFAGLVVVTFVVSGTTLLAMGRYVHLGFALLGVGIASLVGHVTLDLRRG